MAFAFGSDLQEIPLMSVHNLYYSMRDLRSEISDNEKAVD